MTLIQASMTTPLLLNGGVSFRPLIPFLYTHPLPACKSIRNFKTNTNIKIRTSSSILVVRGASQVDAAQPSTSDKQIVPDSDLSITKRWIKILSALKHILDSLHSINLISFGVVGLAAGTTLLSYGFGAYFNILPGSEWSALMLTYGFPLAIIGMALKYAELKPIPCITYSDALALRETKATPVLNQVRKDVARFRYGDEQHLDEALKRIFRYGQGGGIQRRNAPVLSMIREEVTAEGKYSLVLVFEAKALQLTDFEQRRAKFASFFGPGVTAEVVKGGDNLYEVRLISDGTTQPTT